MRGSNSGEGNSSVDTTGDVDQRLEQIITNKYLALVDNANDTPKVKGRKESMDTITGAAAKNKYGINKIRKKDNINRKRAS